MQFPRSHVYACNYFFKLTQIHKLTKLDNLTNSLNETKNLSCRNKQQKDYCVFVLRLLLFIVGRGFLTPNPTMLHPSRMDGGKGDRTRLLSSEYKLT